MMSDYEAPRITELGSVQDLTLVTQPPVYIPKHAGNADVIVIGNVETPVPGSGLS